MISFGENKYKPALKKMWKCCFPMDADSFIDFYFNEIYKNDETLVCFENGKPAAALQMLPYTLKNGGETSPIGYISGAMTHPDHRRKGLMKTLLSASFNIMRDRGFDYTFLIPQEAWLFDFYAKFGYQATLPPKQPVKRYENTALSAPDCEPRAYRAPLFTHQTLPHEVYAAYARFLSEIPCAVLKTETQFRQMIRDFFSEGGVLFADAQGIAFTFQGKDSVVIKEFFYRSQAAKKLFLKTVCDYYSCAETVILNSSERLIGVRGMIMRLNGGKPTCLGVYINNMLEGL
ncbi:MAG: GNAT family N-acetyltransferase [Dysgonamonadaceae bacterium]|jgi:predicted acetyltransferase|nr:GNAT family N-acetyltransferase [Dysgonamonadaceae bacterium]